MAGKSNKSFFLIEPEPFYRFNTNIGQSHEVIKGQVDGSFPTIRFKVPNYKFHDGYVNLLLTLHCLADNGMVLSPHLLIHKDEIESNYWKPIYIKIILNKKKPQETYDYRLKDYIIKRLDEKDYKTSLEKKYNTLRLHNIFGCINTDDSERVKNSGKLKVCLGITVLDLCTLTNCEVNVETFFSCNIFNADNLNIHKICNAKGSIDGGTSVTLLIKLNVQFPIQIGIQKMQDITKLTEWSTTVQVDPRDIFDNHAITFSMPPYGGPTCYKNEIGVDLCVIIDQSTYRSNSVKFYYLNYKGHYNPLKNLLNMDNDRETSRDSELEECTPSLDIISVDSVPKLKELRLSVDELNMKEDINQVYEMITSGQEINVDEHIIHAELFSYSTLCIHNCMHLFKLCGNYQFRNFIVNLRNRYGENLLHVACKSNKSKFIAPFVSMGCGINDQDIFGRTPLHIAIDEKHNTSMLEIQLILKNISDYPSYVKKSFNEMLQVYNKHGYTVLHTATLGGHYGLLENLLKFCVKEQLNAWDCGTLECGDSIGHLILKQKLMELMPLLQEYVPDFKNIKNYEGQTIEDLMKEHQLLSISKK